CPDLQWHRRVHECEQKRHCRQEYHGCTVHGDYFVEQSCRQEVVVWYGKLNTYQHCFYTAQSKEESTGNQIKDCYFFMVDCSHVIPYYRSDTSLFSCGCHYQLPPSSDDSSSEDSSAFSFDALTSPEPSSTFSPIRYSATLSISSSVRSYAPVILLPGFRLSGSEIQSTRFSLSCSR